MNLNEASQHIGECVSLLSMHHPDVKIVVLVQIGDNDISMIANFMEHGRAFEILVRSMSSCFDPAPKDEFKSVCRKFVETIQPTVTAIQADGVVCFWDDKSKTSAMISSAEDYNMAFLIICEHIARMISGKPAYHTSNDLAHRSLH